MKRYISGKEIKTYYALVGNNGLAVYDNLIDVDSASRFLTKMTYKEFDNFDDAKTYSITAYNVRRMNMNSIDGYYEKKDLPLSRTVYTKQMK